MSSRRLTKEEHETLEDTHRATTRMEPRHQVLEARGFVITGQGRFGTWAKVTEAGRQYLARTQVGSPRAASEQVPAPAQKPIHAYPEAAPGPPEGGSSPGVVTAPPSSKVTTTAVRARTRDQCRQSPPSDTAKAGGTSSKCKSLDPAEALRQRILARKKGSIR